MLISEKGREEAENAGKVLKADGYDFDLAYTSVLKGNKNPLVHNGRNGSHVDSGDQGLET